MIKGKLWLICTVLLLIAAALLMFVATGHDYIGLICAGCALLIIIYRFGGRKLKIAVTVLLALGLIVFAVIEAPIIAEARTDAPEDCGWLVVLGAGLYGDRPSLSLLNRLDAALLWLQEHPDCRAVVTGGQGPGESVTEGSAMAAWLTERGIAPERIIVEEKATSTWENLNYSFDLIREAGAEPNGNAAILTSEYHLCRAKLMAADLGVSAYGVAAHTSWPSLRANYFIREALGVTHYRIFGG